MEVLSISIQVLCYRKLAVCWHVLEILIIAMENPPLPPTLFAHIIKGDELRIVEIALVVVDIPSVTLLGIMWHLALICH